MPPIWPFKKKANVSELDEEPPQHLVYKRGEDPNARAQYKADEGAYKDALALFGGGSQTVEAASDQTVRYDGVTSPVTVVPVQESTEGHSELPAEVASVESTVEHESATTQPLFEWYLHSDGYYYKKNADGSFEATAHLLSDDGSYVPYS